MKILNVARYNCESANERGGGDDRISFPAAIRNMKVGTPRSDSVIDWSNSL